VQNFMVSVAEAQLSSSPGSSSSGVKTDASAAASTIDALNLAFNVLFLVELVLNLYAHWFLAFFSNPWSVMDLFVVLLSLLTLGLPVSALRLIRAFRVIRLFGRLRALKKIISALTASIIPMLNAFLILFVVLSICESMPLPLAETDDRPTLSAQL
jgi:hypothetical protein